jgi:hypothetical protein
MFSDFEKIRNIVAHQFELKNFNNNDINSISKNLIGADKAVKYMKSLPQTKTKENNTDKTLNKEQNKKKDSKDENHFMERLRFTFTICFWVGSLTEKIDYNEILHKVKANI